MIPPRTKSIERLSLATLAALVLAPIVVQVSWPLVVYGLGAQGDAFGLSLAALGVAGAASLAYKAFNQQNFWYSSGVAALVGLGLAWLLGKNFQSTLIIALILVVLAGLVAGLLTWLVARLPLDLDGAAQQHKIRAALFSVLAVFTIWQTTSLSTFMGDAARVELSTLPSIPFIVNHSCLTAYVQALKLAKAGEKNLYAAGLWPDETVITAGRGTVRDTTGPYAPFYLDAYMYPPQFLLLPAAVLGLSDNFNVQRALWFGFSGVWLVMGFGLVALAVGAPGNRRALWLIPLLWSSLGVLATLQIGNAHHVVMVMAILAMLAFERQQPILGGALLAFAILAKISPLFFGVILLVQRRWREVAWTFAFGVIFTALTALAFGPHPLQSFLVYQLPRLSSGAAMSWAFSTGPDNLIANFSPFSIPFKLAALGLAVVDVLSVARLTNTLYTLFILGLTVFLSLQKRVGPPQFYFWLGILILSSLQSPFAPTYVVMPVFWLLTLLATEIKNRAGVIAFGMVWVLLALPITTNNAAAFMASLLQQGLVFGVLIFALGYKSAPATPGLQAA